MGSALLFHSTLFHIFKKRIHLLAGSSKRGKKSESLGYFHDIRYVSNRWTDTSRRQLAHSWCQRAASDVNARYLDRCNDCSLEQSWGRGKEKIAVQEKPELRACELNFSLVFRSTVRNHALPSPLAEHSLAYFLVAASPPSLSPSLSV